MTALQVILRLLAAATTAMLATAAWSQAPETILAPCLDQQRPAAERARLCRAIGEAAGAGPALRRSAQEAQARALMEMGNWTGVLAVADQLLASDPTDRLGHGMRGLAYLNRQQPGDAERARDAYTEGMKHAPNAFLFPNNRGVARRMLGDMEGALADHSLALRLQPDFVPALIGRSTLLNARKDHTGALADAEAGLRAAPDNVPLLDEQARALAGLDRPREAIAALDRAVALAPQRPMLHFRRGLLRSELGETEAAIADFTREIAVNPQLPGAYAQRGRVVLDAVKDVDRARADFDRAIAVAPAFAMGWSLRSRAWLLAGDVRRAETDARQALTLDAADPIAKFTLAGLAVIGGKWPEALALLDEVVAALPAVAEPRLEQIAILMRLNRHGEALQSVRSRSARDGRSRRPIST